jgi:hypothetical protein
VLEEADDDDDDDDGGDADEDSADLARFATAQAPPDSGRASG